MTIAVLAAGAGAALALTRDEPLCTLIGGSDGVWVHLTAADRRDLKRATVCVDGRCTTARGAPDVWMWMNASGPRLVPVVLVLERAGKPADVRVMRTRLKRFEPNGPGCGTWWRTAVSSEDASSVR